MARLNMAGEDWDLNIRHAALTFNFLCLNCGSAAYRNFGRTQRQILAWLVRGLFLLFIYLLACCGSGARLLFLHQYVEVSLKVVPLHSP